VALIGTDTPARPSDPWSLFGFLVPFPLMAGVCALSWVLRSGAVCPHGIACGLAGLALLISPLVAFVLMVTGGLGSLMTRAALPAGRRWSVAQGLYCLILAIPVTAMVGFIVLSSIAS